jgi:flagellar hook-associated protein 3 FlgL
MRISTQMIFRQMQSGTQQAAQRVAHLQEAATTGKRINHFADDPINAVRALDLREAGDTLDQYGKNVDAALPVLQQNDATLGDVVNVIDRAKELALQMANGSMNAQDQAMAATELLQLYRQMMTLANTQVDGRYLFGGFKNGAAPFSATGVYLGDNGKIDSQTSASSSVTVNLLGNQLFQGAGVNAGVGVLDALKDLTTTLQGGGNPPVLQLGLGVNLDPSAVTPAAAFPLGPDDTLANWQAGSNFSTSTMLFDSTGVGHEVQFLFRKTGAATWDYQVLAKRSELDPAAPASTDWRQASSGTLAFNVNGSFNAGGSTVNAIGPLAWVNGATSQTVAAPDLSFTGSTQLAGSSAMLSLQLANTGGFATQIGRLDAVLDHVEQFRTQVGVRINAAQAAKDSVGVLQMQTQTRRGEIEGADVVKIYSDFTSAMQAFSAALQSSARLTQTSLLDFLR